MAINANLEIVILEVEDMLNVLEISSDLLSEMSYELPEGKRNNALERVAALVRVAQVLSKDIAGQIAAAQDS